MEESLKLKYSLVCQLLKIFCLILVGCISFKTLGVMTFYKEKIFKAFFVWRLICIKNNTCFKRSCLFKIKSIQTQLLVALSMWKGIRIDKELSQVNLVGS